MGVWVCQKWGRGGREGRNNEGVDVDRLSGNGGGEL